MPGPPPNPNARRRNKPTTHTTVLPAAGRKGKAPAWPLPTRQVAGWADIWRTPQAVMWERGGLGTIHTVARYLILRQAVTDIEDFGEHGVGVLLTELRQLEASLGITPQAMRSLQWVVGETDADTEAPPQPSGVADFDKERRKRLMTGG